MKKRRPTSRRSARPFVLVNMSMTADGKIATANRAVSSFGSARDQEHLYELRATADAVMSGARTVELSRAILGPGGERFRRLRRRRGLAEYNLRVIVSGSGSIDPRAPIFAKRFSPIIVLTTGRAGRARLAKLRAVADEVRICGQREIHWPAALRWLRERWGVRRLLCEGGGELNAALFAAGVVDELHLTVCPFIIGGRQAPTIADGAGVTQLAHAAALEFVKIRRRGDELFLTLRAGRE
jgi:riboflavin-specific deaminase-like protein